MNLGSLAQAIINSADIPVTLRPLILAQLEQARINVEKVDVSGTTKAIIKYAKFTKEEVDAIVSAAQSVAELDTGAMSAAELETASHALEGLRGPGAVDVKKILYAKSPVDKQKQLVEVYENALAAVNEQYTQGTAGWEDVLAAEKTLMDARSTYTETVISQAEREATLLQQQGNYDKATSVLTESSLIIRQQLEDAAVGF